MAFKLGYSDGMRFDSPRMKRQFDTNVWTDYDNGFGEALADKRARRQEERAARQAPPMAPLDPDVGPYPRAFWQELPSVTPRPFDPFNPGDH